MKIRYFPETDTLYIELHEAEVAQTRDLDENTRSTWMRRGVMCGLTIEHARQRTDVPNLSFEQVAA